VHFLREESWWDNLGERDHLEDKGRAGMVILTWIIKNILYGVK